MEDRNVRRGDIYHADLDPVFGSEQGGYRPVLVIQNNIGNQYSPTVIVAAITSKEKMKLPPQPVTALVYTAAAHSANIWTPESAQGQMLEQLGFSLATLPGGLPASHSQGKRHDIVQLGGENLAAGLNGQSLFLFAGDQKDADAIYANPLLAHLPAVAGKRVYPLGTETFRLDYYSALLVLQRLSSLFG